MSSEDKENLVNCNDNESSSRMRTESECSLASDDGSSSSRSIGKRQRTISQQYMSASGLTAASPPKFVSLEEIMNAATSMRDMALVHQIAVEDDFKLERIEPEQNSVQKIIKDTMHRAYWDILREQLSSDPPNYAQALLLLDNIKEGLFGVLLPQHIKLKQQISEILDTQLIKQQAENGTLDFEHYAQYVISVMSKLCAPIRDDNIKQLTETKDVVDTFRGILEVLDLMALDMANFTLGIARPNIIEQSVELERKKFADFLSVQADGLAHTRSWLLKHLNPEDSVSTTTDQQTFVRNLAQKTFYKACIELLEWDHNNSYPETFILDAKRLTTLQILTLQTISMGTLLLVIGSNVGADLQSIASFKNKIKEHCAILIQNVTSLKELADVLPNIAIQTLKDVNEAQETHGLNKLSEEGEAALKHNILDIVSPDHRIYELVRRRVKEFLFQIIESSTAAPEKVPTGLTLLQKELTTIAGQFLKIVSHNCTVFSNYYLEIISKALPNTE